MKNKLLPINNKQNLFCLLLLFFFAINNLSFSQKNNFNSEKDFNLPPGAKLSKTFEGVKNYSYKLNASYNEPINKDYLFKFTQQEFETLKHKNRAQYDYYVKAESYFKRLSNRVKKTFTVQELWYIYMYDKELKTKLETIN